MDNSFLLYTTPLPCPHPTEGFLFMDWTQSIPIGYQVISAETDVHTNIAKFNCTYTTDCTKYDLRCTQWNFTWELAH